MPLCQPVVCAHSRSQWITIKEDANFAIQECKIAGGLKSWWSSGGDASWAYRVIIAATDVQIAHAGDITQIVTDWECLQGIISRQAAPLDPEASASERAAMLERILREHWDVKKSNEEKGKEKEEKDNTGCSARSNVAGNDSTKARRTGSLIFFRSGSYSSKRQVAADTNAPFPGIPLHHENSTERKVYPLVQADRAAAFPTSGNDNESDVKSKRSVDAPTTEVMIAQKESGSRQQLRERFERGLDALEKAVESSVQHEDNYRVYVDCIAGLLHELRAIKGGDAGSPAHSTAEIFCLLSRASLDAAYMILAQQQQQQQPTSTAASTIVAMSAKQQLPEEHKAKEGQGDTVESGNGDTEHVVTTDTQAEPLAQEAQASKPSEDVVTKRLQRCMELFATANKSLASMTPNGTQTNES